MQVRGFHNFIVALLGACTLSGAIAALPSAPEGFIWQATGTVQSAKAVDLSGLFTMQLGVELIGNGLDTGLYSAAVTVGSLAGGVVPSNSGAMVAGFQYADVIASNNSYDFALGGTVTASRTGGNYRFNLNVAFAAPGATTPLALTDQGIGGGGVNDPITLNAAGSLGDLTFTDPLTLTGALDVSKSNGGNPTQSATVDVTTTSVAGTLNIDQTYQIYTLTAIPEPSALSLLLISLGFALRRRRALSGW